ncbi:MAG: protein O-mannosyl-transferase family, partial [bacterium]
MPELDFGKLNLIVAGVVLIGILGCYIFTISPTVSFWDSGEFIATSYILGVPHPPGTPFYVLVGRLFSMIPFVRPALGVNLMSAVSGGLAAFFLYLITVDLLVMWRGVPKSAYEKIVVICSGASAAIAGAFGGSCWTNSIEAEVYAPSAFVMALTTWLVLKWSKTWKEEGARNRLVLIVYLVSLCVGLHLGTVLVLPAFVIFAALVDPDLFRDWRFIVFVVFVGLLGLSNHLYLPIRSHLNPAIDEASPEKWEAFKDCLLRKQYKPMNPFIRNASWSFQFGMFWRYFYEQWTSDHFPWTSLLILFGTIGGIVHFFKHRRTFVLMGVLFLLLSLGLVIYMNFTDHEVRERDYFFAHGFFFFCVWIGFGFAYLSDLVKSSKNWESFGNVVPIFLLIFTGSTFLVNFEAHDRRGEYNAYDYGYNLLATVDRDGLLFTNGDNDTFPLWFMQEVEGFRKDVRVVNLSLLNTSWYIWQLKHLEPKVAMRFTDKQIEALRPYRGSDGKIYLVKDIAAKEIIDCAGDRPVYF